MTQLTLIRGLPGSGKSTLARKLKTIAIEHFEADMFFMVDGEYRYDGMKIGQAHAWCQEQTANCLFYKQDVIVSNTFTRIAEMVPYFEMAKDYKADIQVILCQGNFKNVHNVPENVLTNMKNRFAYDLSELWQILK